MEYHEIVFANECHQAKKKSLIDEIPEIIPYHIMQLSESILIIPQFLKEKEEILRDISKNSLFQITIGII
jgi:hypothetical protein